MLLGFAGAFRRSELVGLRWSDDDDGAGHLEFVPEGVRVHLRRFKNNQLGAKEEIAICRGAYAATCPAVALETWGDRLTAATGAPCKGRFSAPWTVTGGRALKPWTAAL